MDTTPTNCPVCGRALMVGTGGYLFCPDSSDEHDEREYERQHGRQS